MRKCLFRLVLSATRYIERRSDRRVCQPFYQPFLSGRVQLCRFY